ncbi:tRNA (guanine(37)-N1)-methyltransferase-like [Bradysia coprophila]|uniref:tRNA (guanine(37)-N1)-methyltransferase-like n=1 Tax=Bradysia coprophila TaxID=38358 RepID=UPI00187D8C4A|nr:tRNA (guanine(37)-N1)-methyltransferase-like [Bradysia coprophila]
MAVKAWDGIPLAVQEVGITEDNLTWREYELTSDNWSTEEILKSILPMGECQLQHTLPSYVYVGHIIHFNLAEHLLPYKTIIGEVLLDKQPHCRTVTNKCQKINDTFRSAPIEVLCGDRDCKTTDKKNGIEFEFDFSTVYWNPRLKGEHNRIVKLLRPGDVLYDVFAGIGPFSVPAGQSKCTVLANDLNPESFKWLQANIRRNRVTNYVSAFNKDGREFICNEIKNDLVSRWRNNEPKDYKIHITMNLPAMAVDFLNCFCGLLNDIDEVTHPMYPLVHVYCFTKGENTSNIARKLVEDNLGHELGDNLDGVHFVKQVGLGRRYIYRVSFYLTHELLTAKKELKQLEA